MKPRYTVFLKIILLIPNASFAEQEFSSSRETVKFSQAINSSDAQSLHDSGVSHTSRTYYREFSGNELNQGIEINTDAENAIVQLSSIPDAGIGTKSPIPHLPSDLVLTKGSTRRSVEHQSINTEKTTRAMRQVAPEIFRASRIIILPSDMGSGRFILNANTPVPVNNRYMLYIVDRDSDIELRVKSPRSTYSNGEHLQYTAEVLSAWGVRVASMNCVLISPNGRRIPLKGKLNANKLSASTVLDVDTEREAGELWHLEVTSSIFNNANILTRRNAKIALDIHSTTAILDSISTSENRINVSLKVIQAGRFETRAMIVGTKQDGSSQPIRLSYQAEWLEPGKQIIQLFIDKQSLSRSGLSEPFAVSSLQLLDQSRMAVLTTLHGNWQLRKSNAPL